MVTKNFKESGNHNLIIGKTLGHLYESEFFRIILNFNAEAEGITTDNVLEELMEIK